MDHFNFLPADFLLKIETRTEWGSDAPDFRALIRKDLFNHYQIESLLDLSTFPKTVNPFISISHTVGLGGWVAGQTPVGLDIETSDRVISERALVRLSGPSERILSPSPLALWVAKEASFKALWQSNTVKTVSQIEVKGWHPIGAGVHSFLFNDINSLKIRGQGHIVPSGRFTMGITKIEP